MKKIKLRTIKQNRYRCVRKTAAREVPVLSMRHYSKTTRTLNKKRMMILNNLNAAAKEIENEMKIRYD